MMEGLVPNCGIHVISSERRGREAKVPQNKGSGIIQSIREASFQVHAPKLFNSLPQHIRNLTKLGVDEFKFKLDCCLMNPKLGDIFPVHATNLMETLQIQ